MKTIRVIDSHTGGEPTRVVISGGPELGHGSLTERRERFAQDFDRFRGAVVNELNAHYSEYDGMMFYFCSRSCRNIYISTHISGAVREKQYAYICPLQQKLSKNVPASAQSAGGRWNPHLSSRRTTTGKRPIFTANHRFSGWASKSGTNSPSDSYSKPQRLLACSIARPCMCRFKTPTKARRRLYYWRYGLVSIACTFYK